MQGSEVARRAAREALDDKTINQYSPQSGSEELRREISSFYSRRHGTTLDAASEIVVTSSGQEALAASFLALLDPGTQFTCFTRTNVQMLRPEALRARRREVLMFEPFYPFLGGAIRMDCSRMLTYADVC
jgi:aspartate/methionine/tyrosine aminotransferase